jgi:hypothetical protein
MGEKMDNLKIVGISSKQGGGKSSLCKEIELLSPSYGFDFCHTIKFASPIYELHEFILNKMETWTGQPRPKFNKTLLQYLGTEFGRSNYGENVWADICRKSVELKGGTKVVRNLVLIDDMRFENEFDIFPEAVRIRLEATKETRKLRCENWRENDTHPSEIGLDDYSLLGKFDYYYSTDDKIQIYSPSTQTALEYMSSEEIAKSVLGLLK